MPGTRLNRYGLTPKMMAFVHAYLGEAGGNGTKACKLAGYKGSDNTLSSRAHSFLRKDNIIKAISSLSKPKEGKKRFDRQRRLELLEEIAETAKPGDVSKAIDIANKMDGLYIQRVEVAATVRTLSDEQLIAEIVRLERVEMANQEESDE